MEATEKKVTMVPVVDMSECTDCGSCIEVCPEIFVRDETTGYIQVAPLQEYPEDCVQEAISVCPADCIGWEES